MVDTASRSELAPAVKAERELAEPNTVERVPVAAGNCCFVVDTRSSAERQEPVESAERSGSAVERELAERSGPADHSRAEAFAALVDSAVVDSRALGREDRRWEHRVSAGTEVAGAEVDSAASDQELSCRDLRNATSRESPFWELRVDLKSFAQTNVKP